MAMSYEEVDLCSSSDSSDSDSDIDEDLTLPPVPVMPQVQHVQATAGDQTQFLILALSTTGYNIHSDEICQLGLCLQDQSMWSEYVMPRKEFHPEAGHYNGFYKDYNNGAKMLKNVSYGPTPVKVQSIKKTHKRFRSSVKQIAQPDKQTVIIVYNAKYDLRVLFRSMKEKKVSTSFLEQLNIRFVDVLPIIKTMKNTKLEGIEDCSQETVYNYLFPETQNEGEEPVHEANRDMYTLHRIVFDSKLEISTDMLLENSFDSKFALGDYEYTATIYKNLQEMKKNSLWKKRVRGENGVICEQTARNICKTGLTYRKMKVVYRRRGAQKLEEVMRSRQLKTMTITKVQEHFRLKFPVKN